MAASLWLLVSLASRSVALHVHLPLPILDSSDDHPSTDELVDTYVHDVRRHTAAAARAATHQDFPRIGEVWPNIRMDWDHELALLETNSTGAANTTTPMSTRTSWLMNGLGAHLDFVAAGLQRLVPSLAQALTPLAVQEAHRALAQAR